MVCIVGVLVRNLYQLGDVQFADDVDLKTSSRTFSPVLFCTVYINDSVIGREHRGLTIRH